MRKPGTISKGLSALLIGAGTFFGGCNDARPNYQGNNQNQQQRNDDGAGRAGLTALQILSGLYGAVGNGTPQQRNAAGFASNFIGEEKRNEAISNSGTKVYVNNGRLQEQFYVPQSIAKIEHVELKHNLFDSNGNKGMEIHTKFRVLSRKGKSIGLAAYIYQNNGEMLRDRNGLYVSDEGQVGNSGSILKPGYDNAYYEDEVIFMPYGELDGTNIGRNSLKVRVILWDRPDEKWESQLVRSQPVGFFYDLPQ